MIYKTMKLTNLVLLVCICLLLLILSNLRYTVLPRCISYGFPAKIKEIQVPPAPDSHPIFYTPEGTIWNKTDSNIPGILPDLQLGETLGLSGNLDLNEPQHGPIMEL